VTFEKHLESKILKALFSNHVYEEVAYEIYELQNTHQNVGLGMVGEFETPMEEHDFLALVKNASRWNTTFSAYRKTDKKMAVLGGSGSYAIKKCNYGWC
jgi:putative NIF3 family GTP cyclohydrolase 1 type 2